MADKKLGPTYSNAILLFIKRFLQNFQSQISIIDIGKNKQKNPVLALNPDLFSFSRLYNNFRASWEPTPRNNQPGHENLEKLFKHLIQIFIQILQVDCIVDVSMNDILLSANVNQSRQDTVEFANTLVKIIEEQVITKS